MAWSLPILQSVVVQQSGSDRVDPAIGLVDPIAVRPEVPVGATYGEALCELAIVRLAGEPGHRRDELGQCRLLHTIEGVGIGTDEAARDRERIFIREAAGLLVEKRGDVAEP